MKRAHVLALLAAGGALLAVPSCGSATESNTTCDRMICVSRLQNRCVDKTSALMSVIVYNLNPKNTTSQYDIVVKENGKETPNGRTSGAVKNGDLFPHFTLVLPSHTSTVTYSSEGKEVKSFSVDPKEVCKA